MGYRTDLFPRALRASWGLDFWALLSIAILCLVVHWWTSDTGQRQLKASNNLLFLGRDITDEWKGLSMYLMNIVFTFSIYNSCYYCCISIIIGLLLQYQLQYQLKQDSVGLTNWFISSEVLAHNFKKDLVHSLDDALCFYLLFYCKVDGLSIFPLLFLSV